MHTYIKKRLQKTASGQFSKKKFELLRKEFDLLHVREKFLDCIVIDDEDEIVIIEEETNEQRFISDSEEEDDEEEDEEEEEILSDEEDWPEMSPFSDFSDPILAKLWVRDGEEEDENDQE